MVAKEYEQFIGYILTNVIQPDIKSDRSIAKHDKLLLFMTSYY